MNEKAAFNTAEYAEAGAPAEAGLSTPREIRSSATTSCLSACSAFSVVLAVVFNMKIIAKVLVLALLLASSQLSAVADPPALVSTRTAAGLQLSWPGASTNADSSILRPYFEIQRSSDLHLWQPVGE